MSLRLYDEVATTVRSCIFITYTKFILSVRTSDTCTHYGNLDACVR